MAGKPAWRKNDPTPKRADDIHLKLWGQELDASGTTVVQVILALAFVAAIGAGVWVLADQHANNRAASATEHADIVGSIAKMTCVLALDTEERKEWRRYGWYCGDEQRRGTGQPNHDARDKK